MVLNSTWIWAHLFFILYVGKALFKLVLLFNNFHLGWPVTMENWDRRNIECWFKIFTKVAVCFHCHCPGWCPYCHPLVYCSNLLIGLLPAISTLWHLLLPTTARLIRKCRTGSAIDQFKNSLIELSQLNVLFPLHSTQSGLLVIFQTLCCFLVLTYLQALHFVHLFSLPESLVTFLFFSNSAYYPERFTLNATSSSMKLSSGFPLLSDKQALVHIKDYKARCILCNALYDKCGLVYMFAQMSALPSKLDC